MKKPDSWLSLNSDKPIAESRYEIRSEDGVVNKTVWFYDMKGSESF